MCTYDGEGIDRRAVAPTTRGGVPVVERDLVLDQARFVCAEPEIRSHHVGFIGYDQTKAGDKVLLAVDNHYAPEVVEAFSRALRERGARVDVVVVDAGPDREFDYLDEIRVVMRREPWRLAPRRWEGVPWVEELADREGYDLLIHGKGGPIPVSRYRYGQIPWLQPDQLASPATTFPRPLHELINRKTWAVIFEKARGGRVHLTDPEGTDLTYTLHEAYYERGIPPYVPDCSRWFSHLFGHPTPPFIPEEDATGVAAGTTSHYTRAFPRLRLEIIDGRVEKIEGGAGYGDAWREYQAESQQVQYPCFPRPGLFWLWEVAIGTNPKVGRPKNIHLLSSGGFEWERRRSGVIHLGFGTRWRGPEEAWAADRGIVYGHLHIHLLAPTLDITTKRGEEIRLIDRGRLATLDDPEVRALAGRYGDPDHLLREDWIPELPGVNAPGSLEEFASDPARWIYRR